MNKGFLSIFFGIMAMTPIANAQNKVYSAKMDSLFKGFMNADYNTIKPLLDDRVKMGELPTGMNDAIVPQVLAQLPRPSSCKVTSEELRNINTKINAVFVINGKEENRSFLFNKEGKVIEMDILGNAQTNTEVISMNQGHVTLPQKITLPFKIKRGEIFVRATLNGTEQDFLLDSGAPMLILNGKHLPNGVGKPSQAQADGIGGNVGKMTTVHLDSFNLGGLEIRDADVLAYDMGQVEKMVKRKHAGLIGYEVFKEYEITFDYDTKTVTLVKTDAAGNRAENVAQQPVPLAVAPLDLVLHIPVLTITISGKEYRMGLDCGAESNLLYEKHIKDLGDNFTPKKKAKLGGAGKEVIKVPTGIIGEAHIGNAVFAHMRTACSDSQVDQLNNGYGLKMDGLLGYPFLKQYVTTINYKKKEIRFYGVGTGIR